MRIKNSINNMFFGIGSQIVSTILAFITRTVFIHFLGSEYLGVDGLFTNILSLLSLAELGFGSAIIFSLYKPLNDNNKEEIKAYMKIYAKVYRFVGCFVLIIGLSIIPFLPNIIKGKVNIKENINIIYLMFLINTVISYFYSYKQSILVANQQNYKISRMHIIFVILSNILQCCVLFLYRQYLVVLSIQIIFKLSENVFIAKYVDKQYPFINDNNINGELSDEKKKNLYKNVYSLLLYKISGTVINSTDNIVISSFIGITFVGIYSNYLLIISTIKTFLGYIFSSLTASVGNLMTSDEDEKKQFIYYEIFFLTSWLYGFSSICLFILVNELITIWLGKQFVFDTFTVVIIIIDFYTAGMQTASTTYRDTTGLFSVGKYRPIIAAVTNIVVSVLLAPRLKVAGVLLGTIISRVMVYFWFDPYVVHKKIFNMGIKKYFLNYFKKTILVLFIGMITLMCTKVIVIPNIYFKFIVKCILCVTIPNILFILVYRKNKHYLYIKEIIKIFIKSKSKIIQFGS